MSKEDEETHVEDYELSSVTEGSPDLSLHSIPAPTDRFAKISNMLKRFNSVAMRFLIVQLRKGFILKSIMLMVLTMVVLIMYNDPEVSEQTIKSMSYYYYSTMSSFRAVPKKVDLLHTDITGVLKYKNWNLSPIPDVVENEKYHSYSLRGFVSNLDKYNLQYNERKERDRKKAESRIPHNDKVDLDGFEKSHHEGYENLVTCHDLVYDADIQYSDWNPDIEDDLMEVRRHILGKNNLYSLAVQKETEAGWSEQEIVKKNWFNFGSASVWLEDEQCYVTYTRVIYSSRGKKDKPDVSMVRGQAFDKDWKEIKGKRIPFKDTIAPEDIDKEIQLLKKNSGLVGCDAYAKDQAALNRCKVEQTGLALKLKKKIDGIYDKYYVTYPLVFDITADLEGRFKGQEDAKVILKQDDEGHEPVLVFNQLDNYSEKRRMFIYFPHRRHEPLVRLYGHSFALKNIEKNWTPFFHKGKNNSKLSRGHIHFIYSFLPLEILRCNMDDGSCEKVFHASTIELTDKAKYNGMRGGTQFVQLPSNLPEVQGKNMWLGFPKLHAEKCGCGPHFYRPMLSLLVESEGIYHLELIVPVLDFQKQVLSWDEKGHYCQSANVMSPNSIASWEIKSQDLLNHSFEDYLTMTYSEADSFSRAIRIRGLLNYILNIYSSKPILEEFDVNDEASAVVLKTLDCVVKNAKGVCRVYGKHHPEPK